MKPERVCEIFLRFWPPNIITIHLHSFKIIIRFPFYFPSFSQLPKLIIIFLLKKLMGTSLFNLNWKLHMGKERAPNDPNLPFKEKEKGGEGRSKAWWPMEGEGKTPFCPFPFSPQQILLKPSTFFLILRFYFTIVLGRYSRISFLVLDL